MVLHFFLWRETSDQIDEIVKTNKNKIANELADIFIFLTYLGFYLNINLKNAT